MDVKVSGLDEVFADWDETVESIRREIWKVNKDTAQRVRKLIQEKAPARRDQKLRKSIQTEYDEDALEATVYTNLWYSVFPEYGTVNAPAQPYFNPTVEGARNQYYKDLEDIVK